MGEVLGCSTIDLNIFLKSLRPVFCQTKYHDVVMDRSAWQTQRQHGQPDATTGIDREAVKDFMGLRDRFAVDPPLNLQAAGSKSTLR